MTKDQAIIVHRLEVCLSDVRKIAGWKGVELGNMLGLSRQGISTLENQHSRLTLGQYIAIRHILDAWIERHPENKTLPRIIKLLLDDERIFGKYYEELLSITATIAATTYGGAPQQVVDVIAKKLLDEWETPARKYCNEQLKSRMIVEKIGIIPDKEPDNWTERILNWRNSNG